MAKLLNVHEVEGDTSKVLIEIDIELAISLLIGLGSMNSQEFVESGMELGLNSREAEHLDGISSNEFSELSDKLMEAYGKHLGRKIRRDYLPYHPIAHNIITNDPDPWDLPF